jgi:hypothetical protein
LEQGSDFKALTLRIGCDVIFFKFRFQVFLLFLPRYATLHLSLLVHLNSAKLGHDFWMIWGQNLVKFLGFWSTRFESRNRADFGYELESVRVFL